MQKIEWKDETFEKPKEGVVLGLGYGKDIPIPVVFVPLLGWFEVCNEGQNLIKRDVRFWASYNLPQ